MTGDAYGSDDALNVLARAKINLALRVLARETSGYHQIETLFCALELADEIELVLTDAGVTLDVTVPAGEAGTPPDLGPVESNLCVRAATLLLESANLDGGVHIRLGKRIPAGAGLGGGSSDAAAVLRGLNRLHGGIQTPADLLAIGARLGSDIPFFLSDARLAVAWGRGERIMPLPPPPAARVVLAAPPERISTADAYAALSPVMTHGPVVRRPPASWQDIAAISHNDFEDLIFARHPRLGLVRGLLEDAGAIIARMTGTGSAVFGIFDDVTAADQAVAALSSMHPDIDVFVTQTRVSLEGLSDREA